MFCGRIKTPEDGGFIPPYQVFLQEKALIGLCLCRWVQYPEAQLSTCTAVCLLIFCHCTSHAWKWTTAVILSVWAHCLLKAWLERLASLHLPLQQESCFYLSVHPQMPDSDDCLLCLPSPFAFLWKTVLRGDGFPSSLRLLKNYWKRITVVTSQESLLGPHLQGYHWPTLSQWLSVWTSQPKKEARE